MNELDSAPHWQGQLLIQKTSKGSVRWLHATSLFMLGTCTIIQLSNSKASLHLTGQMVTYDNGRVSELQKAKSTMSIHPIRGLVPKFLEIPVS